MSHFSLSGARQVEKKEIEVSPTPETGDQRPRFKTEPRGAEGLQAFYRQGVPVATEGKETPVNAAERGGGDRDVEIHLSGSSGRKRSKEEVNLFSTEKVRPGRAPGQRRSPWKQILSSKTQNAHLNTAHFGEKAKHLSSQ